MRFFISLLALVVLALPAAAQDRVDPNKPDSLLTEDEAEIRLAEWRSKVAGLESQLATINADINAENTKLAGLTQQLADCNRAIYQLLGVTEQDVNNFRERLGQIEARTRQMQRMSDEELSKRVSEIEVRLLRQGRAAHQPGHRREQHHSHRRSPRRRCGRGAEPR